MPLDINHLFCYGHQGNPVCGKKFTPIDAWLSFSPYGLTKHLPENIFTLHWTWKHFYLLFIISFGLSANFHTQFPCLTCPFPSVPYCCVGWNSGDTEIPILNQVPTLFNPFSLVFIETVHIGQKVKDLKEFFESDINDRRKDFQRLSEFGRRRQ